MLRLVRTSLSVNFLTPSRCCIRSIVIESFKENEQKLDESIDDQSSQEHLDTFTKEFMGNKINVTDFQRIILAAGSSIAALVDPRRHDMIACLGETTGAEALNKILSAMKSSEEGQQILNEKPRINTRTVNLKELKELPAETLGHQYCKFLEDNVSFVS